MCSNIHAMHNVQVMPWWCVMSFRKVCFSFPRDRETENTVITNVKRYARMYLVSSRHLKRHFNCDSPCAWPMLEHHHHQDWYFWSPLQTTGTTCVSVCMHVRHILCDDRRLETFECASCALHMTDVVHWYLNLLNLLPESLSSRASRLRFRIWFEFQLCNPPYSRGSGLSGHSYKQAVQGLHRDSLCAAYNLNVRTKKGLRIMRVQTA